MKNSKEIVMLSTISFSMFTIAIITSVGIFDAIMAIVIFLAVVVAVRTITVRLKYGGIPVSSAILVPVVTTTLMTALLLSRVGAGL